MRPRTIILVLLAATITFVTVLGVVGWKPRVQYLDTSAGDFSLTVINPTGLGEATVTTGDVTSFHLTEPGDANDHKIGNVADGVESGDALAYGQAVEGDDFTGAFPNATLVAPILRATGTIASQTRTAGTCSETSATVTGAATGMVPVLTPQDLHLEDGLVLVGRVSATDTVMMRLCGIVTASTVGHTVDVSVIP